MRKLIYTSTLILAALFSSVYVWLWYFGDKSVDAFYLRFTSAPQTSLILGSSRAAQGIRPDVINSTLKSSNFELPIYNYAFTVKHSPYGPAYLESIKKKLSKSVSNGLYILAVDPWSLSVDQDEPLTLPEEQSFVGEMHFVNMKPNLEYLVRYISPLYHITFSGNESTTYLHEDGWLEVNPNMDSILLQNRIEEKVAQYVALASGVTLSELRVNAFIKLIHVLKSKGKIFIVRLPVSSEMANLENNQFPKFNEQMDKVAEQTKVVYLDLSSYNGKFDTTDGNHLHKDAANKVSELIAQLIIADSAQSGSKSLVYFLE